MIDFLFVDKLSYDDQAMKVMDKPESRAILDAAIVEFASCEWTVGALHDVVTKIGEAHGLKLGKAQAPVRLAVTGRKVGPPLFESLELLGRERTLARLRELVQISAGATA